MSEDQTESVAHRLATVRERVHSGMDRREFVRTLASAGYAIGMAQFLGVDDFLAASDDEVPIVTALARADPDDPYSLEERTRTVPAEWYASVEKAFELNQLLAESKLLGYLGSTVVPGDYRSKTASVTVGLTVDAEMITELLGTVAEGVGIDIEWIDDEDVPDEIEDFEDGPDGDIVEPRLVGDVSDGTAPGGVACETETSLATLGPSMYDPDSETTFFVTSEHAFQDGDADGQRIALPTEREERYELGTVQSAYPVEDLVAVEPSGPLEPTSELDTSPPARIVGQYTRWGLADLLARGEHLEKVGAMTGHTTGEIQGVDAVTCFTDEFCRQGQIRWGSEMDLVDGDSGSMSYHPDPQNPDEDVLVAGFNNARTWWPGQSYVWGVAAYQVTETLGYHF